MNKKQKEFLDWLRKNGAQVLATTNPYEYARFIAQGSTQVVYTGRRGITANGFAKKCLDDFLKGEKYLKMGSANIPRSPMAKLRNAIIQRDGTECFFCRKQIPEMEMTVEHLLSKQNGGSDHMDNLALAHKFCNQKAGNLPLLKKIETRENSAAGTI